MMQILSGVYILVHHNHHMKQLIAINYHTAKSHVWLNAETGVPFSPFLLTYLIYSY